MYNKKLLKEDDWLHWEVCESVKLTNGWRWNLRVVLYLYKYNIQIVVAKLPISFVVYLNPI